MIRFARDWFRKRNEARALGKRTDDAEKARAALDIMLDDREWYGGAGVVQGVGGPYVEVAVVDSTPGSLNAFVPPRVGEVPILVRYQAKES